MFELKNEDYLMHRQFKYLKKYRSKFGKWIYVYPNKIVGKMAEVTDASAKKLGKEYDKIFGNNVYSINKGNRDTKLEAIKNTREWQDIVNRKDPEYVTKNEDGSYTYKIDDYILKKKHPVLDMLDDVSSGRDVTTNKVGVDTFLAGSEDYVQSGIAYVALRATILTTAMKYRQGAYEDTEKQITETLNTGSKVINTVSNEYPAAKNYASTTLNNPTVKEIEKQLKKNLN